MQKGLAKNTSVFSVYTKLETLSTEPRLLAALCFNRNIVECKFKGRDILCVCHRVLIETLWNVNEDRGSISGTRENVLIETLWNVNSGLLSG